MTVELTYLRHLIHSGQAFAAETIVEGYPKDSVEFKYVLAHRTEQTRPPHKTQRTLAKWGDGSGYHKERGRGNGVNKKLQNWRGSKGRGSGEGTYPTGGGFGNGNGFGDYGGNGTGHGHQPARSYPHTYEKRTHITLKQEQIMLTIPLELSLEEIEKLPIIIITLTEGWVFVGYLEATLNHKILRLGQNVRVWDTGAGLGPLTIDGPESDVVLDPEPTLLIPNSTVLTMRICLKTVWATYLRENKLEAKKIDP